MKKIVNVGIIGFGTVGSGVAKILLSKGKLLEQRSGISLCIKKICDKDFRRKRPVNVPKSLLTKNINDILNDRSIDIVVELMGGIHPAKEVVANAIANGKHVVTANKALLANHGREIFDAAHKKNVFIGFEASVGGGIPIIKALREGLIANKVNAIYGIVNGTSNFVLTRMMDDDLSFSQALRLAQDKGLAERNPRLDIEGIDSAHKLAILALLGFGVNAKPKNIYTEGIKNIDLADIQYGKKWGYALKLLAIAKLVGGKLELRVHPTFIPSRHILANVTGEDNAIFIKGDLIGEALLFGKGAGSFPAASAVISDLVDISRNVDEFSRKVKAEKVYFSGNVKGIEKIENLNTRYYCRLLAIDKPGVLAKISSVFAKKEISIANAYQIERKRGQAVPIVLMTHEAREGSIRRAMEEINKLSFIAKKTVCIRIER
jgi:homoserine dehydrogenase